MDCTKKLIVISYKLENSDDSELTRIISQIHQNMDTIISNMHELALHTKNPIIIDIVSSYAKIVSNGIDWLSESNPPYTDRWKKTIAHTLREYICQEANKTIIEPTPKSIRKAFAIKISPKDVQLLFEQHKEY